MTSDDKKLSPLASPRDSLSLGLGKTVITITALMIIVEFLIMLLLSTVARGNPAWGFAFVDAILLSIVVAPVTYWCLIRPKEKKLSAALAELSEARREAERRARIDALTGVLSRRAIFDVLAVEWTRAERYAHDLSCLMIDVDHFKNINDTHGHLVGDQVLKNIAEVISGECRGADQTGRYGGEEFLVILPESNLDGAIAAAERVRAAVEGLALDHQGASIQVTVSIGIAQRKRSVATFTVMIDLADAALYRAKKLGRNQFVAD